MLWLVKLQTDETIASIIVDAPFERAAIQTACETFMAKARQDYPAGSDCAQFMPTLSTGHTASFLDVPCIVDMGRW